MKSETNDIYEMLDTLSLPVAAQRFVELSESPEFGSYTALQFIREVLEPQYIETSISGLKQICGLVIIPGLRPTLVAVQPSQIALQLI